MKVLVDTCVWSLALRRTGRAHLNADQQQAVVQLRESIQDHRATLIGPIRQEILSGIRDKTQFTQVEELLDPFRDEEITSGDYVEAARLFNLCQDHGVQCGPVDILVCAVARRMGSAILTCDSGLSRCIGVLQSSGLLP